MIEFPTETVTDPTDHDERLHSVVRGRNDYDVAAPAEIGSAEFDREKALFKQARVAVTAGVWPTEYFEALAIDPQPPAMFKALGVTADNPLGAVELVDHAMDHPFDLHNVFLQHFGQPVLKVRQADRSPEQFGVDFLGARWLDRQIAINVYDALLEAFQVKYFFAYPRPEHHYELGIVSAEYGCPPHPSYVAGHGAFAGATVQTWIDNVELTVAQQAEAVTAGLHLAHYRTLAGVHWAQDNTAGFDLGRKVAEA